MELIQSCMIRILVFLGNSKRNLMHYQYISCTSYWKLEILDKFVHDNSDSDVRNNCYKEIVEA
jgi:hypothetical protein